MPEITEGTIETEFERLQSMLRRGPWGGAPGVLLLRTWYTPDVAAFIRSSRWCKELLVRLNPYGQFHRRLNFDEPRLSLWNLIDVMSTLRPDEEASIVENWVGDSDDDAAFVAAVIDAFGGSRVRRWPRRLVKGLLLRQNLFGGAEENSAIDRRRYLDLTHMASTLSPFDQVVVVKRWIQQSDNDPAVIAMLLDRFGESVGEWPYRMVQGWLRTIARFGVDRPQDRRRARDIAAALGGEGSFGPEFAELRRIAMTRCGALRNKRPLNSGANESKPSQHSWIPFHLSIA